MRDGLTLSRRAWLGLAAAGLSSRAVGADEPPAAEPSPWGGGLGARKVLKQPGRTEALAFSRDGTRLAVAGMTDGAVAPGWVTVWDTATWAQVAKHDLEGDRPDNLAFTPDGTRVVVGCFDAGALRLVRVDDGRRLTLLEDEQVGYRGGPVAFSPDDRVMVAASPNGLVLFDATAWQPLQTLPGSRDRLWQLAAVPDAAEWKLLGGWFLAMDGDAGRVRTPRNPRTDQPPPLQRPARRSDPTVIVRWMLMGAGEGVDRLRHLSQLAYSTAGPSAAVSGLAEDGSEVVTVYDAAQPGHWTRTSRVVLGKNGGEMVYGLAVSPDGRVVFAACADRTLRRWRADDGCELPALKGFDGTPKGLAFSPDGGTLAAGDVQGGAVHVWSTR